MKKSISIFLAALFISVQSFAQTATAPAAGDGSSGSPYQIASLENLYWITATDAVVPSPTQATRWTKYYIQTANINASASSGWDLGNGWTPIGNATTKFTGNYNGGGFSIDSIFINRSGTDYQGLFGYVQSGTVQNLGVTNVNITGKSNNGGLVGYNSATISNCYSTGSVSGKLYSTGGLVGYNSGTINNNCYSTASASGIDNYAGGLVGNNNNGIISNCYSTGSVSGQAGVGGLAGVSENSATISNSYSTGSASGTSDYVGGLVGGNPGTLDNSFWDTQTSGLSSSPGGGTGKTTAQMKTQSTFTGWDFTNIWSINGSVNSGYPYLQIISSLPVELSSFTASVNGNYVNLKWQTATEINNHGFEVHRLDPPLNPLLGGEKKGWVKVGFVRGSGNSNSPRSYSFTDQPTGGTSFSYRIKQIDNDGRFKYYDPITVTLSANQKAQLMDNYPNPFNPSTAIKFYIPDNSDVSIIIYDMLGREVTTLVNKQTTAGYHIVYWNGKDSFGNSAASGVYIYRLTTNSFSETKKMNLLK